MPRSKLEIYINILEALAYGGALKFTQIRHKANYHANDLKVVLGFFIKKNLITNRIDKNGRITYAITQNGITVLKVFQKIEKNVLPNI
jgi:predicted transcriptional regulator